MKIHGVDLFDLLRDRENLFSDRDTLLLTTIKWIEIHDKKRVLEMK
jgi:hypothetical protein